MSNKKIALVASDLHLKPKTWRHRPILGDSYHAWEQIVEEAIKSEVGFVILAGDLLDRQINGSEPIVKLQEGVDKMGESGIRTVFIQGQHEYQEVPWASLSRHATHLHGNKFDMSPFCVYGIDYQSKETLQHELSSLPDLGAKDVLVMHQVWLDWMGERALPQGSFEDVRKAHPGLRTLVSGDLHESRMELCADEHLSLLSPGSTCMQSVAEPTQKYAYHLVDNDGLPGFEPVELRSRPFIRWADRLEVVEDVVDVLEQLDSRLEEAAAQASDNDLPEEVRTPIFHFTYSHEVSDEVRRIVKATGDRAYLFWKEVPPVGEDAAYLAAYKSGVSATMAEMLFNEVPDEKIRNLSERMLAAPDVYEELVRWQKEKLTHENS